MLISMSIPIEQGSAISHVLGAIALTLLETTRLLLLRRLEKEQESALFKYASSSKLAVCISDVLTMTYLFYDKPDAFVV